MSLCLCGSNIHGSNIKQAQNAHIKVWKEEVSKEDMSSEKENTPPLMKLRKKKKGGYGKERYERKRRESTKKREEIPQSEAVGEEKGEVTSGSEDATIEQLKHITSCHNIWL